MKNKNKRHYVYKITNKINGKFYIGVKSCYCDFLETNYFGSGNSISLAIKKYGKHNFSREVIKEFKTVDDAYNYEAEIVTHDFIKNENVYNRRSGGIGGCAYKRLIRCRSIDSNGNTVAYNSIAEASISTGIPANYISRCLNPKQKHYKSCGGLQWEKIDPTQVNVIKTISKKSKKCFSKDLNNNIVIYSSVYQASLATNISEQHIREAIKGTRKTIHGLTWNFYMENTDV